MVKGVLKMALDFAKRNDVPCEVSSQRINGVWYVYRTGPKYARTYRVTEYDDAGEKWLRQIEEKE